MIIVNNPDDHRIVFDLFNFSFNFDWSKDK